MSDILYIQLPNKLRAFIQTHTSRWYDITDCQPITDGGINDNNGMLSNAIEVPAQEVADLVAKSKARAEQLQRVESLLKEWIEIRKARSRRANQKQRLSLQKKEVV